MADLDQFTGQFRPWPILIRFFGWFESDFVDTIYKYILLRMKCILKSHMYFTILLCNIIIFLSIFFITLSFSRDHWSQVISNLIWTTKVLHSYPIYFYSLVIDHILHRHFNTKYKPWCFLLDLMLCAHMMYVLLKYTLFKSN